MSDLLYLFTLLGPVFSFSNFLGEDRTRKIEDYLLNKFLLFVSILKDVLIIIPFILVSTGLVIYSMLFKSIIIYLGGEIYFFIYFLIFIVVGMLFALYLKWYKTFLFIISSILYGVISIFSSNSYEQESISAYMVFIYMLSWPAYMHGTHRMIHKSFKKICKKWRAIYSTSPPWPFTLGENDFYIGQINNYSVFSLVWFLYFLSIVLLRFFVGVLLLPFYLVELLRKKITPEKPIFMDLFAYIISIISVIYLFVERVI